jgi:hypothetical protein
MVEQRSRSRWQPSLTILIAGGVIILGILLTGVSLAFVALVGLGTFGPGALRELGWLRDKDELQRRAAHRAGYHTPFWRPDWWPFS